MYAVRNEDHEIIAIYAHQIEADRHVSMVSALTELEFYAESIGPAYCSFDDFVKSKN